MIRLPQTRSVDAEGAIVAVRWLGLAFAVAQTLTFYRPFPSGVAAAAAALLLAFGLATVALTAWWWRSSDEGRTRDRFGAVSMAVDTLFVLGLCWVYAFDAETAIFVVLYFPPLEAALRWGTRGALGVILFEGVGYAARDVWAHSHFGTELLVVSITFRAGVGVLLALIGGAMADRYQREHERVVGALVREREASEALRSLDDLRSTFLAAVSHELRTPLTSILGFSLTIQQHSAELEPRTRELLDYVVGEARQLEHLLQDLLDIERTGRGGVTLDRAQTDVVEMVRDIAARVQQRVGRPIVVPDGSLVVVIDAAKTERIIDNLLSNAMKYSREGCVVSVRVERSGEGVEVVVDDEGPGVPAELRASIFAPFERGHLTSAHQPGTGIGLSIVDRFARLHGGRAWVQDRDGGPGASFHVYLPSGREGATIARLEPPAA